MNTGGSWPDAERAQARVLEIQTKLHRWATEDRGRRFSDLFNLVHDPAFLTVAWSRVRGNVGRRTAGVDGRTAHDVESRSGGVAAYLHQVRQDVKSQTFRPLPVAERMIPKPGTAKRRRLGIPTVTDRVVQAALKLVLEPIFETDFQPCSYGFRPKRSVHDAIAEIHFLGSRPRNYEWVLDADIEACFDNISHPALMARVRKRVGDKRVLALVKAFLKAGVLTEVGTREDTLTGTPQGGILSPLLANVALSVLDDHIAAQWGDKTTRARRLRHGLPNYRLIRYADDFVIMLRGTRAHIEAVRDDVADVLATVGLRLSAAKTRIVHIDEGFAFLGFHTQRRPKRDGTNKRAIYIFPSKQAVTRIRDKIRALTKRTEHPNLWVLLVKLNRRLRGWCSFYRHVVSSRVFKKLGRFTLSRVTRWIRNRHTGVPWKVLSKSYLHQPRRWDVATDGVILYRAEKVRIDRYRYRGPRIATPWTPPPTARTT